MIARPLTRLLGALGLGAAALTSGALAQAPCVPVPETRDENVSVLTVSAARPRLEVEDTVQLRVLGQTWRRGPCRATAAALTSSNVNVVRLIAGDRVLAVSPGIATIRAEMTVQHSAQAGEADSPRRRYDLPPPQLTRNLVALTVVVVVPKGALAADASPLAPPTPQGAVMPAFPGGRPPDLPRLPQVAIGRDVERTRPANDSIWLAQAARIVARVDVSARGLVDVFRNAAGVPVEGAASPEALSRRERFRWELCGRLGASFAMYADAVHELRSVPLRLETGASTEHAAGALEEAIRAAEALRSCRDLAGLMSSRVRVADWGDAYRTTAQRFYAAWYAELRAVHEAGLRLGRAVRALLPAERRFEVPPALPLTPPTIGGR